MSFDRAGSRLRRATLAAIACTVAAWLAPPEAAAEGTTPVLPQVPALPDAAALPADAAAISTAVVELAGSVLPALPAAPVVEPSSDSTPQPPVKTSAIAPQTSDITPEAPDTAAGDARPAGEPVAPDKPPVAVAAVQVQPVNVNVSVRVASPGDDGAVTQLNASLADISADEPVPPVTAQASGPVEAPEPSFVQAQPSPAAGSLIGLGDLAVQVQPDTWTWNWNCRDAPTGIPELASSMAGTLPPNWKWNWNCGSEDTTNPNTTPQLPSQYRVVTTQYQPVNINVSVRIASAGNNGPVVQTNLAMAVATSVATTGSTSSIPSGRPPPVAPPVPTIVDVGIAVPPVGAIEALSALAEVTFALVSVDDGVLDDANEILDEADVILRAALLDWRSDNPERQVVRETRRIPDRLATPSDLRSAPTIALPLSRVAVLRSEQTGTPARPGAAAKHPRRAALPPPTPLPSLPERVPLATLSLGGATPGTGGDSGFLFLLLIPFALALADAARCVARDRPAIRAQVESSRRERPG